MQATIRESLVTLVNDAYVAAYPSIPIVYDNQPFDRNSPPMLWVEFEIKFAGGKQAGMSASPRTRISGWVYVTVWAKDGLGTKTSLSILDWFSQQTGYARPLGVTLEAPQPEFVSSPPGWHCEQLKLHFYSAPT